MILKLEIHLELPDKSGLDGRLVKQALESQLRMAIERSTERNRKKYLSDPQFWPEDYMKDDARWADFIVSLLDDKIKVIKPEIVLERMRQAKIV